MQPNKNCDQLNYPHLSAGYIGSFFEFATINSKFYGLLFDEINKQPALLNNILVLPQKVPRSGFFEELNNLETNHFRKKSNNIFDFIKNNYLISLHLLNQNNLTINSIQFINWANIALRFGLLDFINKNQPNHDKLEYSSEIALINQLAKIELMLSSDNPVCVSGLLNIANKYINNPNTCAREKIKILVPLIVNFYRHQKKSAYQDQIFNFTKQLLEIVHQFENNNFMETLYASIAYRGIAMASEFSSEMKSQLLGKAEQLAKTIICNTSMEALIAQDNLLTLFQTLSKWALYRKDLAQAEFYLSEMVKLDPFDSVGYSELGFFYIQIEKYDLAGLSFEKAVSLGPPGAGMNAFYLAKCLEKLGNDDESIKILHKATKLDKLAISPWLDLIECYLKKNDRGKVIEIAKSILNSSVLNEQLEDHELITIKNYAQ